MESVKQLLKLFLTVLFIAACQFSPDQINQTIPAPVTVSADALEIYLLSDKTSILGDGLNTVTFTVTRKKK